MEIMTLHIDEIDIDVLRPNAGYSIGGTIYVTIGDAFFPEDQWYDLVYTDLKIWLPGLISFACNHTDSCILNFMDGPYCIRLLRQADGRVSATCLCDNTVQMPKAVIEFSAFIKSVSKSVRKYERMLYKNGLPTQFADELVQLRSILK